jgi:transcriptional regulator
MYKLAYFKEKDEAVVLDFMQQHPFALLCGCDNQLLPVATQLPLLLEKRGETIFLTGHIMKNTDHHLAFEQNNQVLVVFTGPHTYVSASWYDNPQQASTWNYMSVQAKGILRFLGFEELLRVLKQTTSHFEIDPHSPAQYEQLPEDYVHRLANAIVAFEIEVKELENVFKLSQNMNPKSYHQIINKLKEQKGDSERIAEEMQKRLSKIF